MSIDIIIAISGKGIKKFACTKKSVTVSRLVEIVEYVDEEISYTGSILSNNDDIKASALVISVVKYIPPNQREK